MINKSWPALRSFSVGGFTLIELLVVAFIIALLFGVTLSSMRGFSGQKDLEAQKNKFITTLELAKKKARSGDEQNCTNLTHYKVDILNDTTYTVSSVCDDGDDIKNTYTIPDSSFVRISEYDNSSIIFKNVTGLSINNCVIMLDTKKDTCYKLTINESGIINEENKSGLLCTCN